MSRLLPRLRWALLIAAGPAAVVAQRYANPAWVEVHVARGWSLQVGAGLSRVSGAVGFSLAEVSVIALVLGLGVGAWSTFRPADRWARARRRLPVLLAAISLTWAWGMFAWGLNYSREPIRKAFGYAVAWPTPEELGALGVLFVEELNAARAAVQEDPSGVARLHDTVPAAFARASGAFDQLGERYPFLGGTYAPPKAILLSPILSLLGIGGVYDPLTGEPNVNVDVPEFFLPFNACHELAHQRAVAREDEANFVGWLAARGVADADFQYSAARFASRQIINAWGRTDPDAARAAWSARSAAVRRDDDAADAWRARYDTPVAHAGQAMNDAYLRSNGIADGVESYGRVTDLLVAWARAEGRLGAPATD